MQSLSALPFMWVLDLLKQPTPVKLVERDISGLSLHWSGFAKCIFSNRKNVSKYLLDLEVVILFIWLQMTTAVNIKTGEWEAFVFYHWAANHGRDRRMYYSGNSLGPDNTAETNSYLSCSDSWVRRWWFYRWFEGERSQTHREGKQSHLT